MTAGEAVPPQSGPDINFGSETALVSRKTGCLLSSDDPDTMLDVGV